MMTLTYVKGIEDVVGRVIMLVDLIEEKRERLSFVTSPSRSPTPHYGTRSLSGFNFRI